MRHIALIGDSIRIGYEPFLRELLKAHKVTGSKENGGDSMNLVEHFDEWFNPGRADVIYANCGLHDVRVGVATKRYQISPAEYEANLGVLAGKLREFRSTVVVWALTTPVIDERHAASGREYTRTVRDIERYNAIARTVMSASGIMVHDLFAVVVKAGPERILADDGVHFTEAGSRLLAESIAAFLSPYLGS